MKILGARWLISQFTNPSFRGHRVGFLWLFASTALVFLEAQTAWEILKAVIQELKTSRVRMIPDSGPSG